MFFPYEDYIHSSSEFEYKVDTKKKNNLAKYVNILSQDPEDFVAFSKFCNTALFFRNVFCKDAFLYFFLNKFEENERKLLARVVFELFVKSEEGEIGDYRRYFSLVCEMYKDVEYNSVIEKHLVDIKKAVSF
jgi:hypothetical protein